MIGFFYKTFVETGLILFPLFGVGLWGWWEFTRFGVLMYTNKHFRREEYLANPHSALSTVLKPFLRPIDRRPLDKVNRFLTEKILNIDGETPAEKKISYEKEFFNLLSGIEEENKETRGTEEGDSSYRNQLYQAQYNFNLLLTEDMSRRLGSMQVAALASPLLGLLGTVTGMIDTFDVISTFGNSNPLLLAGGISKALLTTQAGLTIAFPLLLLYVLAKRRLDGLKHRIAELVNHFVA